MNFLEAVQELDKGKMVRCSECKTRYYFKCLDGDIYYNSIIMKNEENSNKNKLSFDYPPDYDFLSLKYLYWRDEEWEIIDKAFIDKAYSLMKKLEDFIKFKKPLKYDGAHCFELYIST